MLWNKQTKQNLAVLLIAATVLGVTVGAWAKKPVKTPTDTTVPAAVFDLTVATAPFDTTTVTLTWTATGDDGFTGTADLYDVRYSMSPISDDADFDSATSARFEPLPKASGEQETYMVTGLSGGTEYWLALKVADEAGNFSVLSNVVSVMTHFTPPGKWEIIETVDRKGEVGYYNVGLYNDLAYDPSGNPSIAYSDSSTTNGLVKFAHWNGASWDIEIVGGISNGGDAGISLVYDGVNPSMSYTERGQLKFAHWNGSSWEIEQVDSQLTQYSDASLAYDHAGNPSISYYVRNKKNQDLMFAHWNRTSDSWDIECVEAGEGKRYGDISLAYDPITDNPAIAYRNKFAHWNGHSWKIDILKTNDVFSNSLAYDPGGIPTIVYEDVSESGRIRVIRFAWFVWLPEESGFWEYETVGSGSNCSHAYDPYGTPFISYYDHSGEPNVLKVAREIWDDAAKVWLWKTEIVETVDVANETSIAFDDTGSPSVSYTESAYDGRYRTRELKFAQK